VSRLRLVYAYALIAAVAWVAGILLAAWLL